MVRALASGARGPGFHHCRVKLSPLFQHSNYFRVSGTLTARAVSNEPEILHSENLEGFRNDNKPETVKKLRSFVKKISVFIVLMKLK